MERGARPARPHRRPLFCRAECQEQVNKFPSASFKKFATEKDAWSFVRAGLPGPQQPEPAGSASRRPAGRRGGKEGGRAARWLGAGTAAVPALRLLPERGTDPCSSISTGLRTRRWVMCQCSESVSVGVWRVLVVLFPC